MIDIKSEYLPPIKGAMQTSQKLSMQHSEVKHPVVKTLRDSPSHMGQFAEPFKINRTTEVRKRDRLAFIHDSE